MSRGVYKYVFDASIDIADVEVSLLLALFAASTAGLGMLMMRTMCSRCINFACPLNRVNRRTRELFFARNPVVARAWRIEGSG